MPRLADVCELRTGFRTKAGAGGAADRVTVGMSALLQPDAQPAGEYPLAAPAVLWLGDSQPVEASARQEESLLRHGDVLLSGRGNVRSAVPATRDFVRPWPPDFERIVVPHWFYLLRPDPERLRPEFLAWSLNDGPLGVDLARATAGTRVKFLALGDLAESSIHLPPLPRQDAVTQVYRESLRERRLAEQLLLARRELALEACRRLAN